MSTAPAAPRTTTRLRRLSAAVLGAGLLVGAFAGTASAKTVTGNAGSVTTTCDPVTGLSYKGDFPAGETGQAVITVTYSVKACDKAPVVVDTRLYLTAAPSAVAYDNAAAPLSGKFAVAGVQPNTSYIAKVSVYNAATGTLVGSKSIYAAAKYKGV